MKRMTLLLVLAGLVALSGPSSAATHVAVGPGQTTVVDQPNPDTICPGTTFKTNDDGSYENGYAWAYAGVAAPYYGAFAEGYTLNSGNYGVCGVKLGLTQVGSQDGWLMDVYVWDSAGTNPGNVLGVMVGVNPGTIGMWPTITQHDVQFPYPYNATSTYFVGWWGNWIGTGNGWYVASDENGFGGGLPRTNIAPGIGFPTGWNHPNVVSTFAGCMDLGIAVYEGWGPIVPTEQTSWGAVKAFYDQPR